VKNRIVICLVWALTLAACSPGATPDPVQTALSTSVATAMPSPEPTSTAAPTRIPLSEIDLEPLLFQPGDLGSDFKIQQIKDTAALKVDGLPTAEQIVSVGFLNGKLASDGVTVWLFKSIDDVPKSADIVRHKIDPAPQPSNNIGEEAWSSENVNSGPIMPGSIGASVVFVRCNALVYVQLFSYEHLDSVETYARRLDKRLKPVICGE